MSNPELSGHPCKPELVPELLRPVPPVSNTASTTENMMMVSPSFEILMFHPGLEAIWHRSASTFLGKKCYREVEKRDEPCPHCPGAVALQTGKVSEAESYAVLDDGTRVPFLLRAFPIYGVRGEAAGFVETCECIAERRRSEDDARLTVTLQNELLSTGSMSRVLGLGLDAALHLEGAQAGCVFVVNPETGGRELVAQRGFLTVEVESLASLTTSATVATLEDASPMVRVPILCKREPVGELIVRLPENTRVWPGTRPRLEAVAAAVASALARIKAERLRGDAGMNIQTIIATIPSATIFLDDRGMVTVWNRAAEDMFGWTEPDSRGHVPPFVPSGDAESFLSLIADDGAVSPPSGFRFHCLHKDTSAFEAWFRAAPVRDVIGDGSSHLVVASRAEAGPCSLGRTAGEAAEPLPVGSPLAAADSLELLFSGISRGLAPAQSAADNAALGETETGLDPSGGSISVSWTKQGAALDFHVSMPMAEADSRRAPDYARALVIQSDEENGRRLQGILRDLGCSTTVFTSISAAIGHLRALQDGGEAPDLAVVEMVMPEEPGAVEAAKLLRAVEPKLRVVVSSDRGVVGHTAHGFAAAISRPYTDGAVKTALAEALGQRTG